MENTYSNSRRIGRPPKSSGEKLLSVSLSLPPSMVEQLRAERIAGGVESVSAVVQGGEHLRPWTSAGGATGPETDRLTGKRGAITALRRIGGKTTRYKPQPETGGSGSD